MQHDPACCMQPSAIRSRPSAPVTAWHELTLLCPGAIRRWRCRAAPMSLRARAPAQCSQWRSAEAAQPRCTWRCCEREVAESCPCHLLLRRSAMYPFRWLAKRAWAGWADRSTKCMLPIGREQSMWLLYTVHALRSCMAFQLAAMSLEEPNLAALRLNTIAVSNCPTLSKCN